MDTAKGQGRSWLAPLDYKLCCTQGDVIMLCFIFSRGHLICSPSHITAIIFNLFLMHIKDAIGCLDPKSLSTLSNKSSIHKSFQKFLGFL